MQVLWFVDYDESKYDFSQGDEQLLFVTEGATASSDSVDGAGAVKYMNLDLHSSRSGSWVLKYRDILYGKALDFDWLYGANTGYDCQPLMYDESSRTRLVDANFLLPNKNKYFGFIDNIKHFSNNAGVGQWQWLVSVPIGHVCQDNDVTWRYSEGDSFYSDEGLTAANLGVSKNTYSGTATFTSNEAKLKLDVAIGGSTGIDWDESIIKIYASAIYDDNSESLPGHCFEFSSGVNTFDMGDLGDNNTLTLQVHMRPQNSAGDYCFPDRRIQGVHLYYTDEKEEHGIFWDLGIIDFFNGFKKGGAITTLDSEEGNESTHQWLTDSNHVKLNDGTTDNITFKSAPKIRTFEDYNGYDLTDVSTLANVKFKAACVAGRRAFVGNIQITEGDKVRIYNDRMIVSPINSLDVLPYPANILDLDISDGDEIVALHSIGDKILQFKKNIMYILNISTGIAAEFFVEARHKYKGILNRYAACEVGDAIFWFNKTSAYIYDGENLIDLFISISEEKSQQRLDNTTWGSFITSSSICRYNAPTREVFVLKNTSHAAHSDADCYIYNTVTDSWSFGKKLFWSGGNSTASKIMTNFINYGEEGKLSALFGGFIGGTEEEGGIIS